MSPHTYSRKCKEGHPDHAECSCQQAAIPGLGNLITITDGGQSDLVKRLIHISPLLDSSY